MLRKATKKINKTPENRVKPASRKSIVKTIVTFVVNIFVELFLIIENFGAGVFSLLDFIVAFFISFFSYLYWGIKNILFFLW